jgi:hypothetical protein
MILIVLIAIVLYVFVPALLVVGAVVAIPVGVVSAAFALLTGGPGVIAASNLTASPGPLRRLGGWTLLAFCSLASGAAAVVSIGMLTAALGATTALPTFLPFVD